MSELENPIRGDALSRETLLRVAGPRSYERGEQYIDEERVQDLRVSERRITAMVRGAQTYRVELAATEDGELLAECTCPMAATGAVCKHSVATGLAALGAGGDRRRRQSDTLTVEEVEEYLEGLDRAELVALLMTEARGDERMLDRLRLRAAAGGGKDVDLATFRETIDAAVDPGGFVSYGEALDYSERAEEVIAAVHELLESGYASEVVELADYFLVALEEAGGMVDDSSGHLGVLFDRLQRLHAEGCERADLHGPALAERLFDRMMASEWDLFYDAVKTHAPALGPDGIRRYGELARAEAAKLPELRPGDEPDYGSRQRITHVMGLLAERSGEVDELVGVMRRDLSAPYSFLEIAEAYRDAGREDDALEWAERGMDAFPDRPDSRLPELLAELYRERGRHAEAVELMWAIYTDHPAVSSYRAMKPYAERAREWPQRRDRALRLLRERIAAATEEARARGYGWGYFRDRSELVRIFLWEGDAVAAWREAQAGGCSEDLWLTLAELREQGHPEDALAVYRERVPPTVDRKTKADYRDAVTLLAKVRELMQRLGRGGEFATYLEEVRTTHRRKRSFIKLVDEAGLPGSAATGEKGS